VLDRRAGEIESVFGGVQSAPAQIKISWSTEKAKGRDRLDELMGKVLRVTGVFPKRCGRGAGTNDVRGSRDKKKEKGDK